MGKLPDDEQDRTDLSTPLAFRPQRQFQPPPPEPPPPAESHQSPYVHNPSLAIWLLWIVALLALCVGVVGFFLGMGDYQHAGRGTAGEMAMLEAKWSMLSSLGSRQELCVGVRHRRTNRQLDVGIP